MSEETKDMPKVPSEMEAPKALNYIEKLVAKLCSDGVEYVKVGDIADIGTGSSDRKDAVPDGEYPFYVRSREVLRSASYLFDEESVIIPGEGGIGEIFHFVSGKYNLHQRAYRVSFQVDYINTKFAYYYFAANFKKFILAKSVNATVKSIRKPMVQSFQIPVPPLEVQLEGGLGIVEDVDAAQGREGRVEQFHGGALGGFDGRRDLQQAEVDALVRAKQSTGGDAEQQCVADVLHAVERL